MYPFIQPPANTGSSDQRAAESYIDRVVGRELAAGSLVRRTMKDHTGSKFQIKSSKASAATQLMEMRQLRHQLKALPEDLVEFSRTNQHHEAIVKRREVQNFQTDMMQKIHKAVKRQLTNSGIDPATFRVGGNDRRPYGELLHVSAIFSLQVPPLVHDLVQLVYYCVS
jgi:hypothetical protein